ncbi:MAG: ABC transporter ATP-binding protein [Chloroflexota bacterium]|nr:ABC transporter ATP-binding protein [Dehalococcoidia bacterium]MDW8252251.1 ABC transporter ATP-binding protein [Chloroflexota bacterium]
MTALEVSIRHQLAGFQLDIALSADREVLVLLGRSGAGKSMTLRAVAGLLRPTDGRIVLNGRVVYDSRAGIFLPPQARRVGYVPQNYALFPHLTVVENVAFGLRGVPRAELRRRVDELLELTGLTELASRRPSQLSGGQQQRVALARALAIRPEALLLDEPLSALDAPTRIELRRALRSLQRRFAVPTLFVTHDLSEALVLGDRVAVIDAGQVLQVGAPEELLRRFRDVRVAELTGVRNIWRGQVERVEGAAVCACVGERRVIARTAEPGPAPGAPVWVCVRSDAIAVDPPAADEHSTAAEGTIVDAVVERNAVVLSVRLAGPRLTPERDYDLEIEVPRISWERAAKRLGETIAFTIPAAAVQILPVRPDGQSP